MSGWRKVKNLFWTSGEGAPDGEQELSDEDFAALLGQSEHAVPDHAVAAVDPATVTVEPGAGDGALQIDFQAQYDLAGIPDTDEVEQLERFLNGLDPQLPHASKLAAAKAFLGAVGKSVQDVLTDAERKIDRVRGIRAGKDEQTAEALQEEQDEIVALQAKVEEHKHRMEELTRQLEGVRHACLIEESRLQAARVFFGSVSKTSER